MYFRRSSVLAVAAALTVLTAAGCGSVASDDDPTGGDSTEPNAPPAEVIPSTLVFFDGDGATPSMRGAPVMIADETGLVEFAGDFVDGDPELGTAAAGRCTPRLPCNTVRPRTRSACCRPTGNRMTA